MKHLNILLLLAFTLAFNGCKKKNDEEATPAIKETTVAEDRQKIADSFTDMNTCITQIRDAEGTAALFDFLKFDKGEVLSANWIDSMGESIVKTLDLETIDNSGRFEISANAGTYTWDGADGTWDKTSTPTDKIVVKFPSKKSVTTNNSVFTISDYQDQDVAANGEYYPKLINVNLLVDDKEVFKLNGTAVYDNPIPIDINQSVFLKPFTYSITGKRITASSFTSALNITNGSGCNTKATLDYEFTHSNYEDIDFDKDVKKVTLTVVNGGFKIVSIIDALSLNAIDNPTETEINTYVKTTLYDGEANIGNLEYYKNAKLETRVRLVYKDGSKEDVDVFYKKFLDDLESILSPKFGDVNF